MKTKSAVLASAAALLFVAGASPASHAEEAEGAKIKCEGVNACKSHSDCKTLFSDCAGKNACKGKGFVMLTPEECEVAKAKMKEGDEPS
ncbi:MAG: hypothetical protein JSU66_06595 [Deltaproteobacteria bacterium]|nr:MAG: hypothetical protein JSU66_06595 [Deltaproteobacteria bacterium]